MSIFLSIASYCDPVLEFTITRALATASDPQALHFGVVDQSPPEAPRLRGDLAAPGRLSYVRIDPTDARGPCWARAIAMSLYDDEEWFFQIDSHMDFDPGWDDKLVAQARILAQQQPGYVISSYPNAFVFENGIPVHKPATTGILFHVVRPNSAFEADHPVLGFEAHPADSALAMRGYHLGAGCLFGPGRLAQAFPYDPHFYFHGEEQAFAIRLFTHGWDIFHMPALPVYHLYNHPGAGGPPRPMHWDASHQEKRNVSWWRLEQRSRSRLASLVAGADLGVYSLGRVRSVGDFAAFSGVDYAARTIDPAAFRPHLPPAPTPPPAG